MGGLMSRINGIKARLQTLEARIIDRSGMWPPAEGSFSYLLWDALGGFEERRGFMSMYLEHARQFCEERK
jgi:hypothetical protein